MTEDDNAAAGNAALSKGATVAELPAAATHDTLNPPRLIDFMLQSWRPRSRQLPAPVPGARNFKARREVVSKAFAGELVIVPTGHEKVRANDEHYRFRAGSDFYYLTGNLEPDCVLALVPREGGGHASILFVEPAGRTSATFFTDRNKGELWVGPRLGVPESQARFAVDEARPLLDLDGAVETWKRHPARVLRGIDARVDALVPPRTKEDSALGIFLSEARLLKDDLEIRALRKAIASTRKGFEDVVQKLGGLTSEREIEGLFNMRARVEGNDVGYRTIAATGPNATILHWNRNDGRVRQGTLLLLDAGVEGNELYTADVTRTIPISGTFSKPQRQIYELVHAAQAEAFKQVKPGNHFMDPHKAAMAVLAQGLFDLRILQVRPEEALRDELQLYKRYSLHNTSHMLGIDVHDCAKARAENYKYGALQPGMVLTVEPGLYFQLDDLTVPKQFRGIGVRIEDDVLVTKTGHQNLTKDFPSLAEDVERWVSGRRGPPKRPQRARR